MTWKELIVLGEAKLKELNLPTTTDVVVALGKQESLVPPVVTVSKEYIDLGTGGPKEAISKLVIS